MPKKFPTRKDRQELLEEFRKLGANVAAPELFQSFAKSVKAVEDRLHQLSEPDEASGLAPDLSQDDKNSLMDLYAYAGRAGEIYLAEMEKSDALKNAEATRIVTRLQALLAGDYDALQGYDPAQPKSMPELLEDSRTRTIDLRGRHIKPFGNMQNSRIPMTLKNAEGDRRPGVFTKANKVQIKERFSQILERAKTLCNEDGKKELDKLLATYRLYLMDTGDHGRDNQKYTEKTPDNVVIGRLITELIPENLGYDTLTPAIVRDFFRRSGVDFTNIPSGAIKRLTTGLQAMVDTVDVHINGYNLQLAEGSRLDTRNAAMSAMAGLLGVPKLVARAEPMKFIDDSGQVMEGTFMEYAEGLDLHAHPELGKHLQWNQTADEKAQNSLKKSLADLQVVDYLCLNVDRHVGNLSYVVNAEGYVTGVQAFDNDSSFGNRRATKADALKVQVISRSMKERVMKLTPEMLRFTLRGHGLSNRELYAASARLISLQDRIRKRDVTIVEDNRFNELSNSDMQRKDYENICTEGLRFVNQASNYTKEHNVAFEPYRKKAPGFSEVASTDRRFTMGGVQDAGDRVSRLIHDKDDGFKVGKLTNIRGSSKEFREMVAAAKAVVAQQKQLKEQGMLQERQLAEEASGKSALARLDAAYNTLKTKINAYYTRKMDQANVADPEHLTGKNEYEANRIKYAKNLMSAVKDYEGIRSGQHTEAQQEDKQALLSRRRQQEFRQQQTILPNGPAVK